MDYIRTILIFTHLIVFAFAITNLYKSDFNLFFKRPNKEEINSMGNQMLIYLIILWITGLGVVYIDTAFAFEKIITAQKLITKLCCVGVLTINALLVHFVAFKKLAKEKLAKSDLSVMGVVGAISTASWSFAGFLGVAKPLVKHLSLADFLSLYCVVLLIAVVVAGFLTPRIAKNWNITS